MQKSKTIRCIGVRPQCTFFSRVSKPLAVSVCAVALIGCADPQRGNAAAATAAAPEAAPAADALSAPAPAAVNRLPVSLNSLMVALVNQAADPIWVAAWHGPESEADWRELERRAVQLEVAGALLGVPGTGPLDDTWAASAGWQDWSAQLRQTGADAVQAVQARDLQAISAVGDRIVEVCEGCHIEFKPNLPTGGQFGELSPTSEDLEDGGES